MVKIGGKKQTNSTFTRILTNLDVQWWGVIKQVNMDKAAMS